MTKTSLTAALGDAEKRGEGAGTAGERASSGPTARAARSPALGTTPLRLLVVEDSPGYAALVEQMLRDALGDGVDVVHCDRVAGARLALLERRIDCVLLDLSLPDAAGLEALRVVQSTAPEVPIVVVTGSDDLALAVRAVHEGAQDFLVKRNADRNFLARSVHYAIERKRAEVQLAHQAMHDALTGLPNRVLLADRLELAIARARRRPTSLAVLFLDLDGFKAVNDTLGHDAGDGVLVEIASRLRHMLRPGDTVARFGGDEFLILCEELHGEREAVRVAERARAAIAEPVELQGRLISVRASVGIAYGSGRRAAAEDLIREADAAMYHARRYGNGIELFEGALHADARTELETEHQLRGALARGELRLLYQPEVALTGDGRPLGVEALVRWEHPERGLLSAPEFIRLADETGLILSIGEWVLAEACLQLARWRAERVVAEAFTVSVNLSPRELLRPDLVAVVSSALAAAGLPAGCLRLELTETCLARDPNRAARMLDDLSRMGVQLGLDDFGTGPSSLTLLSRHSLNVVKVDPSFVAKILDDSAAASLVGAVLAVVHAAGLQAMADGIERAPQLEMLRRLGCDGGQGFLFAPALPAAEVGAWLRAFEPAPVGE